MDNIDCCRDPLLCDYSVFCENIVNGKSWVECYYLFLECIDLRWSVEYGSVCRFFVGDWRALC